MDGFGQVGTGDKINSIFQIFLTKHSILAKKFTSGQTSISTEMNESIRFKYPSITFCSKYNGNPNLINKIIKPAIEETSATTFDEIDFWGRVGNSKTHFIDMIALLLIG